MSYRTNPWQSYRQVVTQTASPGQLVLMMYDGAIRFLERSLAGFSHDDPAEFNQCINNNILRAQEIINELNSSLNMRDGGDFAANMRRLYNYLDWRLQQSNTMKQEDGIREAINRLTTLRDAWSQMLQQQAQASHTGVDEGVLVAQA